MNKKYDEILEDMKNTYFNECGERLNSDSQILKRFEAVASELFALSCYGDFIFRQAFIQTAAKENLDRHGALRDCIRKTAAPAQGELTFYIDEPAEEKIVVKENTVCSVEKAPYLQYFVTEGGAIEVGRTSVTLPAQAMGTGVDYNVDKDRVTVMVNAPVGISRVRNNTAFTGGYDEESDTSYRERIMQHYSIVPNGVNAQSVANAVMQLDFVTDCYIPQAQNAGEITVIVATKNNTITIPQIFEIKNSVGISEITGAEVQPYLAQKQNFSLTVEANIRSGFDKEQMKGILENEIREICSVHKIGRALPLNTISKRLVSIDGISSFNIYSNDAFGDVIPCDSKCYLNLNSLAVNCFDE